MNKRGLVVMLLGLGIAGCYGPASPPAAVRQEPASSAQPESMEIQQGETTAFSEAEQQESSLTIIEHPAEHPDTKPVSTASKLYVPANEPEQRSMQQFTRALFHATADGDPALIGAMELVEDAEHDDFLDLLDEYRQTDWE